MTVNVWEKLRQDRRHFMDRSDVMGDDEGALLRLWKKKRGQVASEKLSVNLVVRLAVTTKDLTRRWYERITGRMPVGWYVVALCYATPVILVGWWPWNILLILPVLVSRSHNPLSFSVFVAPEELVRSKVLCGRGGSL
jgi:hypothetical protein